MNLRSVDMTKLKNQEAKPDFLFTGYSIFYFTKLRNIEISNKVYVKHFGEMEAIELL